MPEAVAEWFAGDGSIRERVERVGRIHRDLIVSYQRDFVKYTEQAPLHNTLMKCVRAYRDNWPPARTTPSSLAGLGM